MRIRTLVWAGACLLLALVLLSGCAPAADDPAAAGLDSLVRAQILPDAEDPIHNAVLLVEHGQLLWSGAAGLADGKAEPMTPDHKIKIASIGKMFTATVVLQLAEEGRLRLEDTIDRHLVLSDISADSLLVLDGVFCGRRITIEQLLAQTSGIRDYMEDERFFPDVLTKPEVQYTPESILEWYFRYGTHRDPVFAPGEGFAYADPNYVLLGMIIEAVTDSTLADQYRARIFAPLGMDNSYLEFYEEPRGSHPLSHAFIGPLDINENVNTSFDWAGGGIVSTCSELNTFVRALLDGRLFRRDETLRRMLAAADRGLGGQDYDYGLGIMKRTMEGMTFYGHGGAYDCDLFYCPEKNLSVCMSLNQMMTHGRRDEFLLSAIRIAAAGRE